MFNIEYIDRDQKKLATSTCSCNKISCKWCRGPPKIIYNMTHHHVHNLITTFLNFMRNFPQIYFIFWREYLKGICHSQHATSDFWLHQLQAKWGVIKNLRYMYNIIISHQPSRLHSSLTKLLTSFLSWVIFLIIACKLVNYNYDIRFESSTKNKSGYFPDYCKKTCKL